MAKAKIVSLEVPQTDSSSVVAAKPAPAACGDYLSEKLARVLALQAELKAKAFAYLELVFDGQIDTSKPFERTDALTRASQLAATKADWEKIAGRIMKDYRLLGRSGRETFERFFFANCELSILKKVGNDLAMITIEKFEMEGLAACSIRMIHLAFSSLLAIYDRERKEGNRESIRDFIRIIENIGREKQGTGRFPLSADIALRFRAFLHGLPDPLPPDDERKR